MCFKFKNVTALIVKTFNLLLITILFANPFNAKQIGSLVVMASTSRTTLTEIMPTDAAIRLASTSTKIATTSPSVSATSTVSSLSSSLLFLTTTNDSDTNKMYNSTFLEAAHKNVTTDTKRIDTLSSENKNFEIGLLRNYIMTKHIALSSIPTTILATTQLPVTTAEIKTKTTSTNRKLLSSSTPMLSLQSSLAPVLPDDSEMSFHVNKSQLNVLASFSLLSTKEPLKEETESYSSTSLTSTSASSSTNTSVSTSTFIFPNHQAPITALRHKGNEQSMRSTNSHLIVDNANVTIVTTSKTNTKPQPKKDTVTRILLQSTSYKGSSNNVNDSSSSGSEMNSSLKNVITMNGNISRSSTGTTRISARKVDSRYILSKAHKTDAPMLNYIFDTFSSANKHHHHDQRYGPHFEDVQLVGQPTNMTVQAGSSIFLNCRISLLQDKTVSWVRRNSQGENALDLLTVGLHTYTGDKRYKMEFQYPSNWRLKINNVKKDDEATYECQISTHPPRVIQINLHVNAPKVMIVDEFGDPLQEKYYEQDSTLQLSCVVRNVAMSSAVVFWKHSDDVLNYDVTRGGISVKTELMEDGANSTLFIAKINKADSGNYTCSISEYQNYTIVVHILNGESFAELHHGAAFSWQELNSQTWRLNFVLLIILLLLLPAYIHR